MVVPVVTVECQLREPDSKSNALRRSGTLPASLYGHDGKKSVALTLITKNAEMMLRRVRVNQTPIHLKVSGDEPWDGPVVIREVQKHPSKGSLYHISFFADRNLGAIELPEAAVPNESVASESGAEVAEGSDAG